MANLTLVAGKLGLTDGNDIGSSASRAMLARRASYGVNFNAVWCWSIWPLTLPYLPYSRNSTSKLGPIIVRRRSHPIIPMVVRMVAPPGCQKIRLSMRRIAGIMGWVAHEAYPKTYQDSSWIVLVYILGAPRRCLVNPLHARSHRANARGGR